jgi:hypothetical protein
MLYGGPIDSSVPGTANFRPGSRDSIALQWLLQTYPGLAGPDPYDPSYFNGQRLDEVTSDPASEGLTQSGSMLTGAPMGPDEGMHQSVAEQAFSDTLGGLNVSPGGLAPGTGLAMASPGYMSSYGAKADAQAFDADAVTAGLLAMGYLSNDVDAAVTGGPAAGPDVSGASIAADVSGLTGLNAGVNDAVAGMGFSGDAGPGGAPGGPGDSGGVGITGGDAASGGFSGGVDASGGISW